jgi:hypothetical protein
MMMVMMVMVMMMMLLLLLLKEEDMMGLVRSFYSTERFLAALVPGHDTCLSTAVGVMARL